MVNQKDKGNRFERDIANKLNDIIVDGEFKRVAGSGALGTILNEPTLVGDVRGSIPSIPKAIKIECKVGYGGATQLTLKKDWLNKIKEEAGRVFGIGILIGKFSGARKSDGVQEFVVMDIDDFAWLINNTTKLYDELNILYKRLGGQ